MIVDKLPELVQAAASPLSKIGQMTVLSTGGEGAGTSKITGDVMNVAAQGLTMVKALTGIDLAQALKQDNKPDHKKMVKLISLVVISKQESCTEI